MDRDEVFAALAERVDEPHVSALTLAEPASEEDSPQAGQAPHWIRPFGDTADSLVAQLASDDDRFRLGIAAIDILTRGFGPKELVVLTGFAHAGKSQLALMGILNNPDKRILCFSLDDPAEMLLLKLCSLQHGIAGDTLERCLRSGEPETRQKLDDTVAQFPNLLIVDDSLGVRQMTQAVSEATEHWGQEPDLVIVDYLELLGDVSGDEGSVDDGVKSVAKRLKRWVKSRNFPLLVLHQNTRSRGEPGAPVTMLSMAHGGEQEATIVIGVRRKRDYEKLDAWEREAHSQTVTVHVPKNKRPPSKVTPPEGVDLFIDPMTGFIRPLRESDYRPGLKIAQPTVVESAEAAVRMARENQ